MNFLHFFFLNRNSNSKRYKTKFNKIMFIWNYTILFSENYKKLRIVQLNFLFALPVHWITVSWLRRLIRFSIEVIFKITSNWMVFVFALPVHCRLQLYLYKFDSQLWRLDIFKIDVSLHWKSSEVVGKILYSNYRFAVVTIFL